MLRKPWFYPVVVSAVVMFSAARALGEDTKHPGLFIIGQSATVHAGQEVDAAMVIGGDLVIEGKVNGVALAIGGNLNVAPGASVAGTVISIGGTLSIAESARVPGPRVHVAGGDFSAVVAELSKSQPPHRAPFWTGPVIRVVQVVAVFVIALFLGLWAPKYVRNVREAVVTQPMKDTLVGLSIMLGIVPFCMLLGLSIAGIPLIPVAILLVIATFVLGLTGIAAATGRKLARVQDPDDLIGAIASGMLLLAIGSAVPFLGGGVLFVACAYGAGAVVATRFGCRPPKPPAGDVQAPRAAPSDITLTAER